MITSENSNQYGPDFSFTYGELILDDAKGYELEYTSTLGYLFSIDLVYNNISGEIPEELIDLSGLLNLDLAGNHLVGKIPSMIGKLEKLEFLDLSKNKLNGTIPRSLSDLTFLSRLNLSYNDLSGRIPAGNQLQTLNNPPIYAGNSQLCGEPLLKPCTSGKESHNADSDDERIWLYAGIGPGVLIGFLGFCASLHFISSWRYSYFYYVEQSVDKIVVAVATLWREFQK